MIAAAIVCAAAFAQAATVSWTLTGVSDSGTAASGKAYVFFVEGATADTSWVAALNGKSIDAVNSAISSHKPNISYNPKTAGTYTYNTAQGWTLPTNEQLGLKSLTQYTAYAVIFNSDTAAADGTYDFMVTGTRTATTMDSAGSGSRSFAIGSQSGATWYTTESVPEPTSGLLMLLGVAGLALRRRRA